MGEVLVHLQKSTLSQQQQLESMKEYNWKVEMGLPDVLNKNQTKTKTVSIAIQTLNKLATNNKVTIAWIKAHIGIPGNERADELAKAATIDGKTRSCPPPFSQAIKELKTWTTRETIKEFENSGGKHTKRLLADTQNSYETSTEQYMITDTQTYNRITKQTKDFMKTRQSIRTATHIITQHGENNHHLGKIGKTQNDLCTLCEHEEETVEHIICKCPAIAQKREELSGRSPTGVHAQGNRSYQIKSKNENHKITNQIHGPFIHTVYHTPQINHIIMLEFETSTEQYMITDTQTYNRITKQTKDFMKTRQSIRTATHIITQHGENNHHLGKIGKTQNDLCTLCEHEEETVEHIICKCPAIAQKREELSGSAYLSDIYSTLRNNPLKEAIDIMLLFLKRKKLTINDTED
eukprot:sb/3465254/